MHSRNLLRSDYLEKLVVDALAWGSAGYRVQLIQAGQGVIPCTVITEQSFSAMIEFKPWGTP
jgi:hypothetical protein